jgi:hypothetical protein
MIRESVAAISKNKLIIRTDIIYGEIEKLRGTVQQ